MKRAIIPLKQGFSWIGLMVGMTLMGILVPAFYQGMHLIKRHLHTHHNTLILLQKQVAWYQIVQEMASFPHHPMPPHPTYHRLPDWFESAWTAPHPHTRVVHAGDLHPIVAWPEFDTLRVQLPYHQASQADVWLITNFVTGWLLQPVGFTRLGDQMLIQLNPKDPKTLRAQPHKMDPWFALPMVVHTWYVAPDPQAPHQDPALFVHTQSTHTHDAAQAVLPGVAHLQARNTGHMCATFLEAKHAPVCYRVPTG